jgi:hypothetical protein
MGPTITTNSKTLAQIGYEALQKELPGADLPAWDNLTPAQRGRMHYFAHAVSAATIEALHDPHEGDLYQNASGNLDITVDIMGDGSWVEATKSVTADGERGAVDITHVVVDTGGWTEYVQGTHLLVRG